MTWFKSNWRWAMLNLFAIFVLAFVLTQGSTEWREPLTFDPELESGKWAIRFLLLCLAMTPLQTFFGWNSASKLRKPAGLWSFGFAVVHVAYYIRDAGLNAFAFPIPVFILLGVLGLVVLTALALTSNRWAMRRLGKNWKRLHRLVYIAGNAIALHAILATTASKKLAVRDPHAINELFIYFGALVALLIVRHPNVRRALKRAITLPRARPVAPPVISIIAPGQPPKIYAREFSMRLDVEEVGEIVGLRDPGETPTQIDASRN